MPSLTDKHDIPKEIKMRYLRLSLAASALTVILALPAYAGWMDTTVTSPPPPPVTSGIRIISTGAATGEIQTPVAADIALSLVQSILAMF
jgi:hypothetical protein